MEGCTNESDLHCTTHPTKLLHLYCTDCSVLVCLTCVTKQHQRHNFVEISDIVEEKKKLLNENLNQQVNKLKSVLEGLYRNLNEYTEKVNVCESEIKDRGEKLKLEIDRIMEQLVGDLRQRELEYKEILKSTEKEISAALEDIRKIKDESQDKLNSQNCVHIILYADETSEHLKSYKSCDSPAYHLPSFVTLKIDEEMLQKMFGFKECENGIPEDINGEIHTSGQHLPKVKSLSGENSEKGRQADNKFCVTSTNQDDVKVTNYDDAKVTSKQDPIIASNKHTKIISKFVHSSKVDHIAAVSETNAWIAGSGYLDLVRNDGHVEKSIKIDFPVRGMAMSKEGQLLLATEGKIKKLMQGGEITDFVNVGKFNANGMTVTVNNDVLVCLYKEDIGELIMRLSPQGKTIQTIKNDKNGLQLFSWPWYITETSEGDIWVSDCTEECIIVINKKQESRFKYNGPSHIKMDKQFYPRGMVTNKVGQVVVIDRGNEAVHLVDGNGHFVDFILTKDDGLNGPYSLSQDNEGTIWVGCASRGIVVIAKYLK